MVRRAQEKDLEQIMEIWLSGNRQAHRFVPAEYWESHFSMVREQLLDAEVYVYDMDGRVLGFAGVQGDYLAGIFVDSQFRSEGIGRQFLNRVKEAHPVLTLNVYQKNEGAVKFYQQEGFQAVSDGVDEDTGEREYTMVWRRK